MGKALRARLDEFYGRAADYTAFQSPSDQRNCWEPIVPDIKNRLEKSSGSRVKVLEVGAGKTGFGRFLREQNLRDCVEFHVQDVTRFNETWLKNEADVTCFGDILSGELSSGYDIIFSTYVLEHVTNPFQHLEKIWSLLAKNGRLFIFSPRYDLPGYLCPSARHLGGLKRLQFMMRAGWARVQALVFSKPQFLIQTDLAAFHGPFYLDADAVHWVSLHDLKIWAASHQAETSTLRIGTPPFPSKDWVIKRLCTTALQISK